MTMKKDKINVLIAPNSLKSSLSAFDFADIAEDAFMKISPDFSIRKVPVADGGDLTGEVLQRALDARIVEMTVTDPLGRPVVSKYAVAGKTAIIEMADASGIKLIKTAELNPMRASSFGTGQLMADAIRNGCTEILLGVGGSATVDGGTGMLSALGFELLDNEGNILAGNGESLALVRKVRKASLPEGISVKIICDVDNPLLGPTGAAAVFSPQKGASPVMVDALENGLTNWCSILEKESGKKLSDLEGAGAAGGISLPLVAFLNAEIVPGARFILSLIDFEKQVEWADIVITGEGKIDSQTLNDKAPKAVADVARRAGKPVVAIGGNVNREAASAFDGIFCFARGPVSLEESMKNAGAMLFDFSSELARLIHSFYR